jgi:hypothetical protein
MSCWCLPRLSRSNEPIKSTAAPLTCFNAPETVHAYIPTHSGWPCHARWQFIGRALVRHRLARTLRGRGKSLHTDLVLPVYLESLDRRQAGRIFNRRGVADLFADLHPSCEHRCTLVVAILGVVAEITGSAVSVGRGFSTATSGSTRSNGLPEQSLPRPCPSTIQALSSYTASLNAAFLAVSTERKRPVEV